MRKSSVERERLRRDWLRDNASAAEIILALPRQGSMEEKAELARKVVAARAERRELSSAEKEDLASLTEGNWLKVMDRALSQLKEQEEWAMQELQRVASVRVEARWIMLVYERFQKSRPKTKSRAMDLVRTTLRKHKIEESEPFVVTASIIARIQALNSAAQMDKEIEGRIGNLLVARETLEQLADLLARLPLRVERTGPGIDGMHVLFDQDELKREFEKIVTASARP